MTEMYDNKKHVQDTFTESNLSEYLIQAQWAEFIELKKIIAKQSENKKRKISILDIGVGDGRILKHLCKIEEIWKCVEKYVGIDVAKNCIDLSSKVVSGLKLNQTVTLKQLDATQIDQLNEKFDLIICTWFTAGNFYPFEFDAPTFVSGSIDTSQNQKFSSIFKKAYSLLKEEGEIVIGSMYVDTEQTRKRQEEAYRSFGWEIISTQKDSFTATKEGWWSLRFSPKRLKEYLYFVDPKNIELIHLDSYDYAMLARIKK